MLTTIPWWYYYPHVAAREMEAMRLSNLPEVRGSWWRSRKQNASSSAPPRIFFLQHCHLVSKFLFVFCLMWVWDRYQEKGEKWHFALHPHRLWLCYQAYSCASLHAKVPKHKKQCRPIFRMKLLLQIPMPAQVQVLPSCPPDLAATTSGIPELKPSANNPKLPLSNHSMDILATSILIPIHWECSFPTVETLWLQLCSKSQLPKSPKHGHHTQNAYEEAVFAWANSHTMAGNCWQHFWFGPKFYQRQFQHFNDTNDQVAVLRPRFDTIWFSSPDLAPGAKLHLESAMSISCP